MTDNGVARVRWYQMVLGAVLLTFSTTAAQGENKWVWSGNGRNAGSDGLYYTDTVARPVYRPGINNNYRPPAPVFETTDFTNPPPILPSRPVPRPPDNYRPIDGFRPGGSGFIPGPGGNRPGGSGFIPGPGGNRPGGSGILTGPGGSRPGGQGILTGPVPSWEQRPGDKFAYKDYEHCKCAYSFNCESPGIKFGHCDTGKQYCCYNPKPTSDRGIPPVPPLNRGPGIGYGDSSGRPPYDRPILVGPGGPTGIVTDGDRPFKPVSNLYRPLDRGDLEEDFRRDRRPYYGYGAHNDDLFPRPPYDPYSRNANTESKKNGKKL